MAKPRTQYVCNACGGVQSRWMGKCPDCGAWDALERFIEAKPIADEVHQSLAASWLQHQETSGGTGGGGGGAAIAAPVAVALPDIETADVRRIATGINEFDRVLGGGLVPGSIVLLGGDPGIGKSTLLLQAAGRLAQTQRVLYVTSEESAYQTRLRAERLFHQTDHLQAESLFVLADTNLARIIEQARKVVPTVMVIDSIQMIYRTDLDAAPGSISQLRRCCMDLVYLAKLSGMAILLVGHVTKDGALAGPKILEHLVDAVLSFEGDRHHEHRIVRATKNRFGNTLEVGLFAMTGTGLIEVAQVAPILGADERPRPGSVILPAMHGSRCLLVELQALTATGLLGNSKRKVSGLDSSRLAMLIAVLEKHGGLRLADQDVFVSTVGGLRIVEPAADLALSLAIAGAHYGRALPAGAAAIGEVGLGGEIRTVTAIDQRMREAVRLGFRTIFAARGAVLPDGCRGEVVEAASISEVIDHLQ